MDALLVDDSGVTQTEITLDETKGGVAMCAMLDTEFVPVRQLKYTNTKQATRFDLLVCERSDTSSGHNSSPMIVKLGFGDETTAAMTVTPPVLLVSFCAGLVVPLRLEDFNVRRRRRGKNKHSHGSSTATNDQSRCRDKGANQSTIVGDPTVIDLSSLQGADDQGSGDAAGGEADALVDLTSIGSSSDEGDDLDNDDESGDDDDDDNDDDMDEASDFSDFSTEGSVDNDL